MEKFINLTEKEKPPQRGDKLKIKHNSTKYSKYLKILEGLELEVDYVKTANLGDMEVEVVYFKTDVNTEDLIIVQNPYLLSDFEKV